MRVRFTRTAKEQLIEIKSYIAKNNPQIASKHIKKITDRTKKMLTFPYIGKVNAVYNREDIREIIIEGYKIIYQVKPPEIFVLMIYKNIDFDESNLEIL
ncbi:MAG: type II toxin-antitoxin system mRNA interferase toxin, RelE/StbE family [Candidatus Aminicenantes bacterium]|nr:type II toxin-antitoxin system mRNA interferase toxin, RelE/StbE family [Candidatus Aminicenantes bacterium]NIM83119.1 type II toxin-antitoxin system mRNA interferase toxin, RelE/StbE family [Candidatus Aminicenantes bacterium]NIN22498.1 type II toxin-antitoxin system mRNA interferase toxin, RelE/StbE family [Candidatus Aminicenantes bacterium]NIN46266.1 type II toxin-antitoxin system mRNA interferase toxin, RelE/StbE family [Candidatus Aminicenantes bacterium]NIN89104.1 type II toxin-antito